MIFDGITSRMQPELIFPIDFRLRSNNNSLNTCTSTYTHEWAIQ